jgi:hypothetical protein
MRKILLSGVMTLAVMGCTTTAVQDIAVIAAQIASYTKAVCAFAPNVQAVISVINALYPAGIPITGIVTVVGDAICQSPLTTASALKMRKGVSRGTTIIHIIQTPQGPILIPGTAV